MRKPSRPVTLVSVALTTLALGACQATGSAEDAAPGLTEDTITLGNLVDETGPFAATDGDMVTGLELYWDDKNAAGGVCGRTVEVRNYDHKYDPQTAVSVYPQVQEETFAIQAATSSPVLQALAPRVTDDGIPTVQLGWSPSVASHEAIFVAGTHYDVEMIDVVDYLVEQGVVAEGDSIGYVYLAGDYGSPGVEGAEYAAEQHGLTIVRQEVDASMTDLTAQVQSMRRSEVKAVLLSASPPQLASLVTVSDATGLDVPIYAASPSFHENLLTTGARDGLLDRVYLSSPLAPYFDDSPGIEHLHELYDASDAEGDPSLWLVLGYAGGELMYQALENACADGELSREGLQDALADFEEFDTGGAMVTLTNSGAGKSPSAAVNILKPNADAPGGLELVEREFVGPTVQGYLDQ